MARIVRTVRGAVIEHVPLILKAHHAAVVIPHTGITAEIINDHAAVRKAVHGVIGHGITKTRGSAVGTVGVTVAVRIGKEIVVFATYLFDRAALVKFVLCHRQGALHDAILLDLDHVFLELCHLSPGELSPVEVGLPVIVDQHAGVNAPHALQKSHVNERSRRALRFCHAVSAVGHAIIEVIPAVTIGAIGRVQRTAILCPGGIGKRKHHAVIGPMDHIVRGIHVMHVAAKACFPLNIKRAVKVHATVLPHVGFHVGNKNIGC